LRSGNGFPLLGWIVHDMIRTGKWTGIEHGFVTKIVNTAVSEAQAKPGVPLPLSSDYYAHNDRSGGPIIQP
jgi:hypothetical protein